MAYRIDPDLAELLPLLPVRDWTDPASARSAMDDLLGSVNAAVDTTGVVIEDRHIPGPEGAPDVAVRVYAPAERSGAVPGAAGELGIDTERVGVYGQSAGGGLSAALALLARDRGGPALCFQYLGIPELDDRLDTPSMRQFVDTPVWHRANAVLSWQYYLGDSPAEVSAYAAPASSSRRAGAELIEVLRRGLRVGAEP